jgi:hypothetical protein
MGAERLAPPGVVVDEAGLGDELAAVVVDPVPGKGAGTGQLVLAGAVGVDGQGEGGPGHWSLDLDEWLVADPAGGGKPGPSARGLGKAHPGGGLLRLGSQVGHGDRGERDARRPVADPGHVDTATAGLTRVNDASVVHLDPGLEPVGQPEPVGCLEFVQVTEDIGWRRIVVCDAEEPECQAVEPLSRSLRDPGQRGDRRTDAHGAPLSLPLGQAECR